MSPEQEVVHAGAMVPKDLADALRDMAQARHRSVASEIRIALIAHVGEWNATDDQRKDAA